MAPLADRPALTIAGYEIGAAIHQSRLRSIYRAVRLSDGLPVVIKTLDAEYPSRQHVALLRREFHILQRLQSVEAIVRVHALEHYGNGTSISAAPRRKLSLSRFFSVASAIADALARVHEFDVVHKNIEPRSILVDDSGALRLIDFSISSELSLERQNHTLSRQLEAAAHFSRDARYLCPDRASPGHGQHSK